MGTGEVSGDVSTIYALSSGRPPCGVAVIRISGKMSRVVLETMVGSLPAPRRATLRSIRRRSGDLLDRGLVLWLPGPATFTGEDMVEFQVHGGRAVIAAVTNELAQIDGVRAAEAGEFTRRAFLAGRVDLTEAEGLADLLAAETEGQRRAALDQAGGALRRCYDGWRNQVLRARALIEADLDFADEEDVPGSVVAAALEEAARLRDEVRGHLEQAHRGERLRDGVQVVLLGRPNAGKSSLLNALARRDVAIVSEEAGTTRDLVEVHLDLGGLPVIVVDTAGLRESGGAVEREGMRRALERSARADLVLHLRAPSDDTMSCDASVSCDSWSVRTKADLVSETDRFDSVSERWISVATGEGLDRLVDDLTVFVRDRVGLDTTVLPTRDRHRSSLRSAVAALDKALTAGLPTELVAEELRRAGEEFGRLTGRIGADEVLGEIFGSFCIGK